MFQVRRVLGIAVAALFVLSTLAAVAHEPGRSGTAVSTTWRDPAGVPEQAESAALGLADVTTTTTAPPPPPTTTTTRPPPPTTTTRPKPPPPPTTAAPAPLKVGRLQPPAVPVGLTPYVGLGTWVDVYDWSSQYTNGHPAMGPADVDRMADQGVQTLFIQASKWDANGDSGLVDPDLLKPLLRRAKGRGLRVVGWYLPTFVDLQRDLDRTMAVARLEDVDSVGIDVESKEVSDVNDRNRRLVEFSRAVREALPGRTIGAIVLPPVVLEVVNPNYWPDFPYKEIAPSYDVWMTMGYWTNRKPESGYRDAYRYTKENVDRLRADVGVADLPVHPIGGIGDKTTPGDVENYRRAAIEAHAIGGSLYDWRTTTSECWPGMAGFRA